MVTNTIIESCDVVFYENLFITILRLDSNLGNESTPLMSTKESEQHEPIEPNEPNELVELRRSKRARIEKSFGPDFIVYIIERPRKAYCKKTMISLNMDSNPLAFEEAMKSQDVAFWK